MIVIKTYTFNSFSESMRVQSKFFVDINFRRGGDRVQNKLYTLLVLTTEVFALND